MFVSKKLSLSFCAVALSSSFAHGIQITSTGDASVLSDTLIIPNSGVTVTSAVLSGGNSDFDFSTQAGTYTNATGTYGLPSEGGVVFSTGDVSHYEDGPNNFPGGNLGGENPDDGSEEELPDNGNELECPSCFGPQNTQQTTTNTITPAPEITSENSEIGDEVGGEGSPATDEQNALLSEITGQSEHFDPIELSITFDVDDSVSVISFVGAFGSEEYPDFVNSEFVDGFGMFLNGVNVAGTPASDGSTDGNLLPININHPDFAPVEGTELNGLLAPNGVPILRFDIPVEPGSTGNTFTLLLADASDSALDTTIFLSSFGNFDAETGDSEFTPILPDTSNPTNENGDFVFVLPEVEAGETIWIDPDVATGYTYTATDGGLFASVTAPTLLSVNDSDGYLLSYLVNGVEQVVALASGQTFEFDMPVPEFTISSINVELALDPTDPLAFVTGVAFSEGGQFGVIQSPNTEFVDDSVAVSAPGTFAIFALSLLGLCGLRRKKF
ncbi:choice-of-anchor L domain-containing protein [Paraglaciecola chathamensis]|uniref:choice-of-anchor L domain-containing protein n=1 Tax=Paraglaciecola chathamensis TaxID=368405 RepID=UPI0026F4976E|nr:choice-of-anchor L domain-containing protein [Paraglaciecola chathamensis]MDO6560769.1 choice-of-anchor L domain-containing protein [Paraglaciecola chathamensis]